MKIHKHTFGVDVFHIRVSAPLRDLGFSNLDVTSFYDHMARQTVEEIRIKFIKNKVFTEEVEAVEFPADWWESLKARWAPGWFLKKYPVKKTRKAVTINHFHVCPHIAVPKHTSHIEFLIGDRTNAR